MHENLKLSSVRLSPLPAIVVHVYTSLGLGLGFLALIAVAEGRLRDVFLLLALACAIDATDGPLARHFQVVHRTPQFDGRKLDDIVDYLNYVLVPVFFAYRFALVPPTWIPALIFVLLASGYGFCQKAAKTEANHFKYFTGFPSYWNFIVFYLYLLNPPPVLAGLVLLIFALLVFVPIKYILPLRPPILIPFTIVLAVFWLITLALIFVNLDHPDPRLVYLSLIYPLYYLLLSFYLELRTRLGWR